MKSLLELSFLGNEMSRPPVWMMRQAGRYLPEYRALKEKFSFLELCRSTELALEVSMQPIRRLDMDIAIVFADILLPLEGMGIEIDFNPGPVIKNKISSESDISSLTHGAGDSIKYVPEVISLIKGELQKIDTPEEAKKDVVGFAGAPWTLACYISDQGPYKWFHGTEVFAKSQRKAFHQMLEKITDVIGDYVVAQVEAGAGAIQLFDTWGGMLNAECYKEFSLPYLNKIFERIRKANCKSMLYINGSCHLLPLLKTELHADGISIDWRMQINDAIEQLGDKFLVQGNFDPSDLFSTPQDIEQKTSTMLNGVHRKSKYIANLGHGIYQTTPVENAKTFIESVKKGW